MSTVTGGDGSSDSTHETLSKGGRNSTGTFKITDNDAFPIECLTGPDMVA